MIWYFAYGSNMDPARLIDGRLTPKGVAILRRIGGRLDGWRLAFDKVRTTSPPSGAGNIRRDPGSIVFGTLNEMPEAGLLVLDEHEGVAAGHYRRETVPVVRGDSGGTVEAVTYVALKVSDGCLLPLREYLGFLLGGRDLLPADYFAWLEKHPCVD